MTDWKQITARIRRARTGKDPAGQLSALFAKTRDAMVAFELARYFESTNNNEDAGKWYLTAAERFRRADWKTKAQEAATRLGATVAAEIPALPPKERTAGASEAKAESETGEEKAEVAEAAGESVATAVEEAPVTSEVAPTETEPTTTAQAAGSQVPARRRGRGRRGGREQQRPNRGVASQPQAQTSGAASEPAVAATVTRASNEERATNTPPTRSLDSMAESSASFSLRGRSGDPGLSSRLSQLEMNFRRLLACSPSKLDDAAIAPAGPGVWILSDEDLSTYYYVESCKTLRVAIGQLLRGSARSGLPIKPQLAEHLGIPEARVAKYLSDHCVVRWLQMDDDSSNFAHFLIAVLRPKLNE
jgi:hypothetical protein